MHSVVEAAEKILDKEYKVLDHGFVRLVDYMGSDDRFVQSARVSYGEGTKTYRPIFVARQWVRHRTGRMNEISGRYSVMKDECYIPDKEHIALQSEDNKQGRKDEAVPEEVALRVQTMLKDEQERIFNNYHELLDMGIAREISRIDLPLSLYTEFYWQMDLHNLFHFLALRLDGHAQYEIREYARTMFEIVKIVCPIAAEAFENHKLNGVSLSGREKEAVKKILSGEENPLSGREKEIFLAKLN